MRLCLHTQRSPLADERLGRFVEISIARVVEHARFQTQRVIELGGSKREILASWAFTPIVLRMIVLWWQGGSVSFGFEPC